MSKLFVAYGSNLSREQMARRCPQACVVGGGLVYGYRLRFRGAPGYGVANIEPARWCSVPVLLWEVNEFDEQALDAYEGVPRLYTKDPVCVTLSTGRECFAWAYIMTSGHGLAAPAAGYFETILRGYEAAGFTEKQKAQLLRARDDAEKESAAVRPRTRWL